ncbi:hypothetical protein BO79DRAFT_255351 [Aspergillus costaricaensis CBS 115574]|uniref:Uncharacterized protein n=1 Tax=Aspergillus costaricaensis CBS 115574 TaxID=1448317 RepID=A0ACD1IF32_9EURO|nr:hypothetical protein BO79DRAFT_255351 [Aspergillus costaricaensis CBS 115574]RAK88697.1 hypothetical protein BO79DRAFT_255351 [Aspergillus costaricaensis CBS 115574]
MKYQRLASLGFTALSAVATVSANPLLNREAEGQCPQGYTQSVYYKTITLQPSSTAPTAPTSTLASVGEGQCPVGYTQSVYYKTITLQPTSTASVEPTSAPAVESTSAPAVQSTSSPAVESSSTSVDQVTTLHSSSTVIVTEVVTATPAVATTSSAVESVAPVATTSVAEASPAAETSAAVEATSSSSSVVEVTTNAAVNAAATTAAAEPTSEAVTPEVITTEAVATTEAAAQPTPEAATTEAATSQAAAAAATTEAATTQAAATTEAVVQSTSEAATTEAATTEAAATQAAATTVESKSTSSSSTAASAATSSASSSSSSTSSSALSSEYSGEATFYGGNVSGGTCSFTDYTIPSGLFGTALSSQRWDNAAECGSCVEVTGPSGTKIKAMVVDECPECDSNHLDLFESAFSELADISKGVISIDWEYVACGITSPIELVNKSGTSAYWFAMQVVNSNLPVTKLEVSTDSGSTWQSTTRSSYNYFENQSGFGTDTVDVRVTAEGGSQITVKNVSVSSGSSVTASSNFE